MERESIDVVVVNYRSFEDTLHALRCLDQRHFGTVWLVDNSAQEPDVALDSAALRQAISGMPWVQMLCPGSNIGFGRACNLAFSESTAEFFLLLNPDARIAVNDVMLMAKTLADQPKLGAVSPKIYWNSQRSFVLPAAFPQTPQHSATMALVTHSRRWAQSLAECSLTHELQQMTSKLPFEVPFLAGAVMMVRRAAALSSGGLFDPDYFMFFEDADLSIRLRRAGYMLAMVPAASAEHEYRHKAFKSEMMATSQHQYFSKQYPAFYRWSGKLSRVAALAKQVNLANWFRVIPKPVKSAQEFSVCSDNGRVLAFSPSVLMMPALFRPSFDEAMCFTEEEWSLLEPACYTVLVQSIDLARKPEWFYFERAAV